MVNNLCESTSRTWERSSWRTSSSHPFSSHRLAAVSLLLSPLNIIRLVLTQWVRLSTRQSILKSKKSSFKVDSGQESHERQTVVLEPVSTGIKMPRTTTWPATMRTEEIKMISYLKYFPLQPCSSKSSCLNKVASHQCQIKNGSQQPPASMTRASSNIRRLQVVKAWAR